MSSQLRLAKVVLANRPSINLALSLAALGKRVGILDADIYGPSLPRLIGLNRNLKATVNDLTILAWGLQTMSIGYLVAEDAPTIWRGPMVMSATNRCFVMCMG